MRTIRISDEVWDEIAKQGKFGETEDDVLRRVFGLEDDAFRRVAGLDGGPSIHSKPQRATTRPRRRYATVRMHAGVHQRQFVVSFEDGKENRWALPSREDKEAIRRIRREAVTFAVAHGASKGQEYAVFKALTDAGYHLTK